MRRLTAEDLWRLHRVGAAAPFPDGRSAVTSVTSFSVDEDEPRGRLFRVFADGSDPRPLGDEEPGRDTHPQPSPDGRRIAFVGKAPGKDSKPQVHVVGADGTGRRCLTDMPLGARDPRWLPDGRRLVCVAELYAEAPTLEGTRALLEERGGRSLPRVTESRVYRFWDRWLTDGVLPHLFVIDAESGEARDITPDGIGWLDFMEPTGQYDVSPDGAEIVVSANATEPPHERLRWAVFAVPVSGGAVRCLTAEHPGNAVRPRYTPDGRWIIYGMQRRSDFYADRVRLVRYDREAGTETVLTEEWDASAAGWEIAPDGCILFEAEERGRRHLFRMTPEGGGPVRVAEGGTCAAPRPGADGSLWFLYDDLSTPPELRWSAAPGEAPRRVTRFDEALLSEITFGRVEERSVAGADGVPVQTFVVYPPDWTEGERRPLVQLVHGGPHGLFGDSFHARWNAHLFAAPGYVVSMVNFHGSSSFGTEFLESIHGRWGDQPTRDVLAATDHLVEQGLVDAERMALAGGSYGGYLTAWIATQTHRFACGVCHAGVYDRGAMYASDVTQGMPTALGCVPWEDPAPMKRHEPATHVKHLRTPMLILHGEKDYRVPYTQALQFYGVLKARGIPARLVCYADENHWILSPRNAIHWWGEVHGWLGRYLGEG